MGKAKIGFEVDEVELAKAKAYVARHGTSLNKLVSALFASLGQDDLHRPPPVDETVSILLAVSVGRLSIVEASRRLELPDAGYVLHLLAEKKLPLPRLPDEFVKTQLNEARSALEDCLVEPAKSITNRAKGSRPATA
ncbi:MAG: hypothetical protein ACEQSK_02390 [Sphingomonadaceae bacterium]